MRLLSGLQAVAALAFFAGGCGIFAVSSEPGPFPCTVDSDCAVSSGYRCELASNTCQPGAIVPDGGALLDAGPEDAGPPDAGHDRADAGHDAGYDEEEGEDDDDAGPPEEYVGEEDAGVQDAGDAGGELPEGVIDPADPALTLLATDSFWTREDGAGGTLADNERLYGQEPTTGFSSLVGEWTNENTNGMGHYEARLGGLVHPLLQPLPAEHDGHIWVRGNGHLARYLGRELAPFDPHGVSYALGGLLWTSAAVPSDNGAVARMGVGPLSRNNAAPLRGVYVGFRGSEVVLSAPGPDGSMTSWRLADAEADVTYLFAVRVDIDVEGAQDELTAALWLDGADDAADLLAWRRVRASVDVAADITHASFWRDDRLSSSDEDHRRFDELRFWSVD